MKIRRFLAVFLLAALLSGLFGVPAAYAVDYPKINAKAALLVDGETGLVLFDKNAHTQQYPASITKVMVALLVLEAVDRGELKMDQQVTASARALADLTEDSSTADIQEGEVLTVEQLLYCLMVVSIISVSTQPGDTQLTRTPFFPFSLCGTREPSISSVRRIFSICCPSERWTVLFLLTIRSGQMLSARRL